MKVKLTAFMIGILIFAFFTLVFWCSGSDFKRGEQLATLVLFGGLFGGYAGFMFWLFNKEDSQ